MLDQANKDIGPRNRAPLGNKTTNVKATAFQTPAPPTQEKQSAKPTSPRFQRARVKVQEAEAEVAEDGREEWEIEYMPPREVPLPDYPDDWPHDRTYPQFEGKNLTRGWWFEFCPQKDDDDDEFSDFDEKLKKIKALEQKKKQQQQAQQAKKTATVKKTPTLNQTTRDPLTSKPPETLKSRSAASALSNPIKPSSIPSFAAPTAAAKARLPSAPVSKKPTNTTTTAGNSRHTAARVASNSTMGYSKGRVVSAATRKPASAVFEESETPSSAKKSGSTPKTLDELFNLQDLDLGDDEGFGFDSGMGKDPLGVTEEDDGLEDFQLDPVEI